MASYMYTSASGTNWDDDDDEVAETAEFTLSSARLALEELEKQSAAEYEQIQEYTQSEATAAAQIQVDYKCHPDYFPTFAGHITERWYHCCSRPAYTALSTRNGYVYSYERRDYHANWLAVKLQMGANMKNTAMMAPSKLRLSRTWVSDGLGEYVEDRGYEYLSLPPDRISTPRLSTENESGDERDEAHTPPDTPSMAKFTKSDVEVEVGEVPYDPTTGAIDLPAKKHQVHGD